MSAILDNICSMLSTILINYLVRLYLSEEILKLWRNFNEFNSKSAKIWIWKMVFKNAIL